MAIKLKYVNFGIASRQNNIIFINQALKQYPDLHKAILEHEKAHSSGLTWQDLTMDLKNSHLKGLKRQYYQFILKNPKSLIEFMPLWVYEGNLVMNPLLSALYLSVLIIWGAIWIFI